MRRRTAAILIATMLLGVAQVGCSKTTPTAPTAPTDPADPAAPTAPVKTTFDVEGMTCGSCEAGITGTLLGMDGVSEATASHSTGKVDIVFDASRTKPEAMAAAIDELGYTTKGWTPPE